MKAILSVSVLFAALLMPVAANALCICLECVWKPKRHFVIQSGNMKPALNSGDCVVIDLIQASPPIIKRGEIVVFDHPVRKGVTFVSRVIGLSGDTVQMKNGVVWLNKSPLMQKDLGLLKEPFVRDEISGAPPRCANPVQMGGVCEKAQIEETLPNKTRYVTLDVMMQRLDNTGIYTVPNGHVFMLGDNRDSSADSRISEREGGFGFVPMENIIGILNDLP